MTTFKGSFARFQMAVSRLYVCTWMKLGSENDDAPGADAPMSSESSGRFLRTREAVLRAFCDPIPEESSLLFRLSSREWKRLLRWLDTSGLALYLLDRLNELGMVRQLPEWVRDRLEQNCRDNAERTRSQIAECNAIHLEFQRAHLSYAIVKGLSFWPKAAPKLHLRSQLDIDFLMAESCAPHARRILEERGYLLQAISGRTWEFKTTSAAAPSIGDLYKAGGRRSVELHLEARSAERRALLDRAETLNLEGICVPILPPAERLLGHGMHLYKHVMSEFIRAAHMIEFRRHVIACRSDEFLWSEVRSLAGEDPKMSWGLGIVTLLAERLTGTFAPRALTHWTVDRLPAAVRAWVDIYGARSVLARFPGSKLYLLAQSALECSGIPRKRSIGHTLVPLRLPPPIVTPSSRSGLLARALCSCHQLSYILFRLRFHVVEGARYAWEAIRWRSRLHASG